MLRSGEHFADRSLLWSSFALEVARPINLGCSAELLVTDDRDIKEDKFDFDEDSEDLAYIGLDQALAQAMEHARDNTDFYLTLNSQEAIWD